jgi:hypothetical protein
MKRFEPNLEHIFYNLALVIAVILRFVHLGNQALSEYEAGWAMQALHVSQGMHPAIGANPAYVHLTAILFYIFGATTFLARFIPALAGTALVLGAWLLRPHIGRVAAIILAFGLAIDPGLVAMSHLAGGPMLAIAFLLIAMGLWLNSRRAEAGFLAGLALLSGASLWSGLLGLALTWLLSPRKKTAVPRQEEEPESETQQEDAPKKTRLNWAEYRPAILWGAGSLVVFGSLFLLSPKGLPAILTSFGDFLRGWWTLSGVPAWQPLLALPAYEILPIAFGIAAAVRALRNRQMDILRLTLWALVAIILVLIYPGRSTGDLTWASVPLWILAAIELSNHLDFQEVNLLEVAGTLALVLTFVIFGWLNLANMTNMDWSGDQIQTRIYLLAAVALLIFLGLLLVATGWSIRVARLGGVWSAFIALTLFTVAMSTGAASLREPLTMELWQPLPRSGRVDIIVKVAGQISDLNKGYAAQLPVTFLNLDSPALQWSFRDWSVEVVQELPTDSTAALIISPGTELNLAAQYRGEPLTLHEAPDWAKTTTRDWLKWFIYRQAPLQRENVILWVRDDLMLDSQNGNPTP